MPTAGAQLLEDCIEQLKRGELTEERLRQLGKAIDEKTPKRQSLLYLQTATSAVTSPVIGMLLVAGGVVSDGPFDPADWPYKTTLEAIDAGWRVIRFPVQLLTGHSQDVHVICWPEYFTDTRRESAETPLWRAARTERARARG